MRTFLFGSEMGSSLSHFWKGLAAKEEGRFWPSHAFGVVVPTSSEDGSNVGELGGGGLPELRMSAAWIGLTEGLEAEGPVVSGLLGIVGFFSKLLTELSQLAAQLGQFLLCVWVS